MTYLSFQGPCSWKRGGYLCRGKATTKDSIPRRVQRTSRSTSALHPQSRSFEVLDPIFVYIRELRSQRAKHKEKSWRSRYWWASSTLAAYKFYGSGKQRLQLRRDHIIPERKHHIWISWLVLPILLYRLSTTSNGSLGTFLGAFDRSEPWYPVILRPAHLHDL